MILRASFTLDDFVKSPSAALRFNFVVAEGRGGSPSRPISGNPTGCPYHQFLRALHLELFTKPSWRLRSLLASSKSEISFPSR
jgi:hypothetical protein